MDMLSITNHSYAFTTLLKGMRMKYLFIIVCILFSTNTSFAGAIQDNIRKSAQRKYPNDSEMQQYVYQSQYAAYWYMQKVSDEEVQSIATQRYPKDYSLQRYVYDEQLSAKQYMQTVEDREIKKIAVREYPKDYSLQEYIYNNQLAAKLHVQKVNTSRTKSESKDEFNKPDNVKEVNGKATDEHETVKAVKDNAKLTAKPNKTKTNSPRIDKRYVESKRQVSKGVSYKPEDNVVLSNRSDSAFAIYKDEKLDNITNLFTNGIKATIKDLKTFPDKPTAYKIKFVLKDGSVYGGWVNENVINE